MTDPDKSGASADETGSEQGTPAQDKTRSTGAEDADSGAASGGSSSDTESEATDGETESAASESSGGSGSESTRKLSTAETGATGSAADERTEKVDASASPSGQPGEQPAAEDDSADASGEPVKNRSKLLGVLLGVVSSLLVVVVALALVGLFVWPGYAGPGSPDQTAEKAASALASKDPAQLEQVSCKSPEGKPTTQIPPQAMQMIAAAQSTGPPQVVLDTEAHAPMNLTLSAQGQTQALPSIGVLGVSEHQWCLKGLAQQQQGGGGGQ